MLSLTTIEEEEAKIYLYIDLKAKNNEILIIINIKLFNRGVEYILLLLLLLDFVCCSDVFLPRKLDFFFNKLNSFESN